MTRQRDSPTDYSSIIGMGPINTTGFLFGDDDEKTSAQKDSTTSPDVKSYLQMNTTDDKFPILIRNNVHPGLVSRPFSRLRRTRSNGFVQLSASSAALDLAETQTSGWTPFARHRPSQQSLPQNIFEPQQSSQSVESPTNSAATDSPTSVRQLNRRSMEAAFASQVPKSTVNQSLINGAAAVRPIGSFGSSYSTNDIPTLKNANGTASIISPPLPKPNAQQQFHNHNASLGRIPPNAVNNRVARELPNGDARREEPGNGYKQMQSELHASAAPFGPSMSASTPSEAMASPMATTNIPQYPGPAYYGGYGMQLMNMGVNSMHASGAMGYPNQMSIYQGQSQYPPYQQYVQAGRFADSQARVIQQRRLQNVEGMTNLNFLSRSASVYSHLPDVARFTNTKIENYEGDIYALCKDQHGCRYLQKQLETHSPETIHLIFVETNPHVVELMTGNDIQSLLRAWRRLIPP